MAATADRRIGLLEHPKMLDHYNPDLKLILDAFGIKILPKLYRRAELKSIKTALKIFI